MRPAAQKSTNAWIAFFDPLPAGMGKYVGLFLGALLVFVVSFGQFESFYSRIFLHPVSFLGYYLLHIIGVPLTFSSKTLSLGYCDYILPDQILRVNFGCTGFYVLGIFIAAVIVYPVSARWKMWGLLAGIPLFTAYSIARLVIMGAVGNWIPQYLDIIHSYLMIIINAAFLLWMYSSWLNYAVKNDPS